MTDSNDTPKQAPEPARAERLPASLGLSIVVLLGVALATLVIAPLIRRAAPLPKGMAESTSLVVAGQDEPGEPTQPAEAPKTQRPPLWRVKDLESNPTYVVKTFKVGRDPAILALRKHGVPIKEARRIAAAFKRGERSLDRVRPEQTFVVAMKQGEGHVVGVEYQIGRFDVWQAKESESGQLEVQHLEFYRESRPVAVGIAVSGELRDALKGAGLDDEMMQRLEDSLDGRVELSGVTRGARMRIVAEEERVEGEFVGYKELLAVEYLEAGVGPPGVRVYHFNGEDGAPDRASYYDRKFRHPFRGGWRSPVPLGRISSRFNPKRMHPVLKRIKPHNGVDFAAPPGTPVYAAHAGRVTFVGASGPSGNLVRISHDGRLESAYCHLSRFATGVRAGTKVDTRQLVGYVGSTGRATGPHLHFAVKKNGQFIDPLSLKLDGTRVLPSRYRDAFSARADELDKRVDGIALPPAPAAPAKAEKNAAQEEVMGDESE